MALTLPSASPSEVVTFFHSLTGQEAYILALALQGWRSNEIGNKLSIVKCTVDTHRRNIMTKWHIAYVTIHTGKRAAREMMAIIRPYAATYLPPV